MSRTTRKTYMHIWNLEDHLASGWGWHDVSTDEEKALNAAQDTRMYTESKRDGYYTDTTRAQHKHHCKKALRTANKKLCLDIMKSNRKCYDYDEPYDWKVPYSDYYLDYDAHEYAEAHHSDFITVFMCDDKIQAEPEVSEYESHPYAWEHYYREDFDSKPYPDYRDGQKFYWWFF